MGGGVTCPPDMNEDESARGGEYLDAKAGGEGEGDFRGPILRDAWL